MHGKAVDATPAENSALHRVLKGPGVSGPKLRWSVVFILSVLFASSFFTRHIAGYLAVGSKYTPFVYSSAAIHTVPTSTFRYLPDDTTWDESWAYAPLVQGLFRGEKSAASMESYRPYLLGVPTTKRHEVPRIGIGEALLAACSYLPGSSVISTFITADFVFVFACSVALMALCFSLRPTMWFSVAGAAFVLFFNWRDFRNQINYLHGSAQNSSMFLRTPYPQLAFPLFVLLILSLYAVLRNATYPRCVALALALTLNSYTYFYSWTYGFALVFAVLLLLLASHLTSRAGFIGLTPAQRTRSMLLLSLAAVVALLLSFPIWRAVFQIDPVVADLFLRTNGEITHRVDLGHSLFLLSFLTGLIILKHFGIPVPWLTPAVLISALLVLNIQVISGKTLQPNHWSAYFIQPLLQIGILDLTWELLGRVRWRPILPTIACVLAVAGMLINVAQYWTAAIEARSYQSRSVEFDEVVTAMRKPMLVDKGFVSNDSYLAAVLPAYVREKPLMPKYIDPLSNVEFSQLQLAAAEAAGFSSWSEFTAASGDASSPGFGSARLHYRTEKVIAVMNRHRPIPESITRIKCPLLENSDFVLFVPCPSAKQASAPATQASALQFTRNSHRQAVQLTAEKSLKRLQATSVQAP